MLVNLYQRRSPPFGRRWERALTPRIVSLEVKAGQYTIYEL
jgi:hypothetical protein